MIDKNITKRNDFPDIFDSTIKIGVELGVAKGDFSQVLISKHKFDYFYCIDKWNDHHNIREKNIVLEKFSNNKEVIIVQKSFSDAVKEFEDQFFDFIYIDGYAHTGQDSGRTLFRMV
jgi:hypothetical protein